MHDRQLFQIRQLENGITLYVYLHPSPIARLEFIFPVGAAHAHASNGLLPGAPHFLEHTQLIRSHAFPAAYELDRELGLKGGHTNGTTYQMSTHYELDAPSAHLDFAVTALLDRVYRPVFAPEDLDPERSAVINERNQRKFYPGNSPVGKYYHSEFMSDQDFTLDQLFGSDEDLAGMSADYLRGLHEQISFHRDTRVILVAPEDSPELAERLEQVETVGKEFAMHVPPTGWQQREYHTAFFESVSQPTLEVAWIRPRLDYREFRAVSFFISLLTNSIHGSLHHEFREEKGWTYGLDGYAQHRHAHSVFGLSFPMNKVEHVEYVRDCLLERIETAIGNQALVEAEIARYIGSQVYSYQTAGSILDGASYDLDTYGRIYTEAEWQEAVRAIADPAWRQEVFRRNFNPNDQGMVCFMPERRHMVPVREVTE